MTDLLSEITGILFLREVSQAKAGIDAELKRLPKNERDHIGDWWADLVKFDRAQFRAKDAAFLAGEMREPPEGMIRRDVYTVEARTYAVKGGWLTGELVEAAPLDPDIIGMVYLAYYKDVVDQKALADELYWEMRTHYEAVLTNKVREVGCDPSRVRLEENAELTALRQRANQTAAQVVDTYNRHLRVAIQKIVLDYEAAHDGTLKGMNRNVLSYRVGQWNSQRDVWKDKQIAITEATFAAHRTITQFLLLNAIEAKVFVRPVMAVCQICKGLVANSPYTPSQAANLEIPAHPGCPHSFELVYDKSTIPGCENLWRGQPVWQLRASYVEGGDIDE